LALLIGADLLFVRRAWSSLNTRGLSVDIVFGLEYAIMLTEVLKILAKYILHTIDLRSPNPWENKPIYIRYIDIFLGIIELLLYAGYMVFMLMVPFIPLHIARRVYRAARDFHRSIHDVMTSHQAIRNLNTL
jgi:E3 ubiquitin-protein ligase synoviolin